MKANEGAARAERGFTLVETSIALLVMLVAGLATSSLFVYAIKFNTGAQDRAVAQSLAQRQMEVVRETEYGDIAASDATVTSAGRQYRVVVEVCNDGSAACGGSATVKRVTVRVTPVNSGAAWALSSVTLITMRSNTSTGDYF